jgi:hypothetical protein
MITHRRMAPTNGSLSLTCAILRRPGLLAEYTGQNAGENAPTPEKITPHRKGPLYTAPLPPKLGTQTTPYGHHH